MDEEERNREAHLRIMEGIGSLDGRFTNIKRLGPLGGGGAWSLLFKADDSTSETAVAIKVFSPHKRSDQYRFQSFMREGQLLSEIGRQKDIVSLVSPISELIHEIRLPGDIPFEVRFSYYALELAHSDVAAAIANSEWDPEHNLVAFREMCRSIQRIHRLNIAHRDLKPSNFLIMPDRSTKLSDLGTGRRIDENTTPLLPSYSWGPPGDLRYSAPELFALLHDEDPVMAFKADFYSLGAILFELFSGSQLANHLFDSSYAGALMNAMGAISRGKRRDIYDQFVGNIASAYRLPELGTFGASVPGCITKQLDDLYMSLAHLDYRKRCCDFVGIFRKIEICLLILRNETKYRSWRERKRRLRGASHSDQDIGASKCYN